MTGYTGVFLKNPRLGAARSAALTVAPAQVAAPVQLEALSVAVRGADRQPVARQKVWSAGAVLGQRLRLVQLIALWCLRSPRRGHRM